MVIDKLFIIFWLQTRWAL